MVNLESALPVYCKCCMIIGYAETEGQAATLAEVHELVCPGTAKVLEYIQRRNVLLEELQSI